MWVNDTASVGIPAWRYYYNASFPNTQKPAAPGLGVYHASEIPIVFKTYPQVNVTTQEFALSQYIQGAWARFAKNPQGGPGWNAVGTGAAGQVPVGATDMGLGGYYIAGNGSVASGSWDLGVLGNAGNSMSSGVTVISPLAIYARCAIWKPVYAANQLGI